MAKTQATNTRQKKNAIGLFIVLISSFILLSFISYLFNWKFDQDKILLFRDAWSYLISDERAANLGGRLGAVISHIFFFQGIGIYSFIVVLYAWFYGWRMANGQKIRNKRDWLYSLILILIFACPITSFILWNQEFPYGGGYGRAVVSVLSKFFGEWGAGIILFALIALFAYFSNWSFLNSIFGLIPRINKKIVNNQASVSWSKRFRNFWTKVKEPTFISKSDEVNSSEASAESLTNETLADQIMDVQPEIVTMSEQVEFDSYTDPNVENQMTGFPDWLKFAEEKNPNESEIEEEEYISELPSGEVDIDDSNLQTSSNLIHIEMPEDDDYKTNNAIHQSTGVYYESPDAELHDSPLATSENEPDDIIIQVAKGDEIEDDTMLSGINDDKININPNVPYDPKADLSRYQYPTIDLLDVHKSQQVELDKSAIKENIDLITNTLDNFGIKIDISKTTATVGPTVTLYEIVPEKGVRISKIRNLEDDIALNLAALGIRIIAPMPGKGTIGIEVPNANRQMVGLRTILASEKFASSKYQLPLALGKTVDNQNMIIDLASLPHLLMAGATGQGKSVGINTVLISLLYKLHPSQLKFVLIDPKKVELSVYRMIEKHYLAKLPDEEEAIITDTKKVVNTLNALCIEMDQRYDLLKLAGARNLKEYNEKFINRKLNPKNGHKFLPFIVLVVDEFADLIMTAGKEVEIPIARLAQLARAIGIHLIVATQRPDTKVITGTIKANFPARIAFKVSSQFDSRTIMDTKGAEQLIGKGDMLLSAHGEVTRVQCAFVDTHEVERIVDFIGNQQGYPTAFELPEYIPDTDESLKNDNNILDNKDQLFEDAARLVISSNSGSTSMLQRRFNLGYNRAGRIMDQLEAAGIVGPSSGGKAREVLVSSEFELEQILENL